MREGSEGTTCPEGQRLEERIAQLEERLRVAEQALREAGDVEFTLRTVLDLVPLSVFWKRNDLEYLGCNARFARDAALGAPSEIVGKRDGELCWRDQAELYNADDRAVIADGVGRIGYEEPQQQADGRMIWLRTTKVPLRDRTGQTVGVLGMYEDITATKDTEAARKRLEAEVDDAQAQLLRDLAAPLIPITKGVVALVLVGTVDDARGGRIMESLLAGIQAHAASIALIDITGVSRMEPRAAKAIVDAARAARLLGAQPIVTGISPEIARALVDMAADVGPLLTLGTLQAGIEFALRRAR